VKQIAFSPSGVKTPNRAQPANPSIGKGPVAEESYAQEAFAFAREHLMQRDVEVQVDNIDKGGTFLGSLYLPALKPNANVGVTLLSVGLGKLHPSFAPSRVPGGDLLLQAQESAKAQRIKVWENYVEDAVPSAEDAVEGAQSAVSSAVEKVTVTDVRDDKA
jgi:staphylococcal nuclease domain-containing protein 1